MTRGIASNEERRGMDAKTPAAQQSISPVGETAQAASRRRRSRSPEYAAIAAEMAPFAQLARQIILRRGELGWSQQTLAETVGTSHSAISRLESGQHAATVDTLTRVGKALGLRLTMEFVAVEQPTPEIACA